MLRSSLTGAVGALSVAILRLGLSNDVRAITGRAKSPIAWPFSVSAYLRMKSKEGTMSIELIRQERPVKNSVRNLIQMLR